MDKFEEMTDDDLMELVLNAKAEQRRRKEERQLPVFAVDGVYYKSLTTALERLIENAQYVLQFRGGKPEEYFGSQLTDGIKCTKLGLGIEFWSESEYTARPDRVWGAPE